LGTNITKALEPAINRLKDAWTTVTSAFSKAWNAALSLFKDIWNSASTFFSSIWEGMIRVMSKAGNWFGGVWQTVTNAFSRAWTRVSEIFVSIWEGIKGIIIKFIDWLWPVIDKIIAPFKAVGKAIGSIINTVGGWFSDAANAGNTALDAYDKANAKTSGAATVIEEAEPPVSLGYIPFDASKFGVDPALYADGVTGGKSKLHGVVDISGGASIPGLTGTPTGTATGGAAGSSISESAALASILSVIRHIDGSVAEIVRMPRLRTASSDAGSYDAGSGDINPRNTAPVTQAERIAYSMQERRETVVIEVAAAQGTEARIVRSPKNVNIRLVHSGANYE
jgi:hypothetical protein